jgi:CRISPR-associated protein Cmr4
MFEQSEMLFLYVETPLHAGSGSSVGIVDLPIQRERVTHFPLVQASGIKGKLRSEAEARKKSKAEIAVVFGPENVPGEEVKHAGAVSPGDARLLLFPVRSLVGVFAWTTSSYVLARFKRDLEAAGKSVAWPFPAFIDNSEAWTVDDRSVVANSNVVLEEFTFRASKRDEVKAIAEWLALNAFPQTSDYDYFRDKVKTNLVILPEDAFRDFAQFATEVVTRIRIDQEKKTVAQGALWTEEHLPADTLLYTPLHASRPRIDNAPNGWKSADDVLKFVHDLELDRIQLGGDETVGRGIVKLRFGGESK